MSTSATKLQTSKLQESTSAEIPSTLFSPKDNPAIACLLLVVTTLAFYNPIAHCGFVYSDDVVYVMRNPAVHAGLTWETVKWAFVGVHAGFWHPLTWLSHALDYQLFGANPAGHHYVSLLFHAANAVLLFLLLLEATGAGWPSLIVAAIFALHPENVESVTWAAERKNVLSMFFFLLALWAYGRYARRPATGRYLWVAAFFALGLMSKPQVITLPCVLLLWDYWPLGRIFADPSKAGNAVPRSFAGLLVEKLPLFLIAAAGSAITLWTQRVGTAVRSLDEFPLTARLGNALVSYVRYLSHTFWPSKLAPLYPHEGVLPFWQVGLSLVFLTLVTVLVFYCRKERYLLVGWLWFLGTLVPMIGIVQVGEQAMADRFAYIPMIGLFVAIVWGISKVVGQFRIPTPAVAVVCAIVFTALGLLSCRQLRYWRDGETLWRYTLKVTNRNYVAHDNLAMVFDGEGKPDEAIAEFRASEELHAYPADQILKIGMYEQRNGHLQGAIEQYGRALNHTSDPQLQVAAWSQTGSSYIQMRQFSDGNQSYERVLQINPDDPSALVATAMLAERDGKFDQAAGQLSHAMKVQPTDVGYILMADALRHADRQQDAQSAEDIAQRISPGLELARKNATQTQLFFGYISH